MADDKGEMSRSIKLPQTIDIALRNIKDAKIFAMDIGGSLTKIAYYSILPFKKMSKITVGSILWHFPSRLKAC